MRFIIILFFSLCHLITKAHDPNFDAKGSRMVSFMHFDGKSKDNTFIHATADINGQDELVIDIDDDDNDLISARKYTLLVKTAIIQFYLQLFPGFYQNTSKNPLSCPQQLITSTNRYISQRALRI
ncbi:hypothetical protein D0C36_12775 [Mucilaginibacter conchicola]|uniref:Uncharacterized protein n=1 Tax=Mucilaginibacter conchicola TaxID=2303333 RepID=A0A372NSP4_9SPHI|nr:hypothetical protein [Mucilaginibacter conchicola]RFZ92303.1 hypothetical protein D0C36_12775 [Mucilaginibacter conchicola]